MDTIIIPYMLPGMENLQSQDREITPWRFL